MKKNNYKVYTDEEFIYEIENLVDMREYDVDWEEKFYKITKEMIERLKAKKNENK